MGTNPFRRVGGYHSGALPGVDGAVGADSDAGEDAGLCEGAQPSEIGDRTAQRGVPLGRIRPIERGLGQQDGQSRVVDAGNALAANAREAARSRCAIASERCQKATPASTNATTRATATADRVRR